MATVLLVRHGRTAANTAGLLAGRTPGIDLDERGVEQARTLAERLREVPLAAVLSSPLERCQQTAQAVLAGRPELVLETDDRLVECGYGDWTNRPLKELAREPLWKVVQGQPSAVVFPGEGGESLRAVQSRATEVVRSRDAQVAAAHGEHAVWLAVSHGDVIKAVLADALGLHLDQFQRLVVDPCSVSVVTYTPARPFVVRLNDSGAALAQSVARPPRRGRRRTHAPGVPHGDAAIGGGAGAP